jgi:cytosine/adenosine deaminase-related metal-dependent hydrolase
MLIEDRGGHHMWSNRSTPAITPGEFAIIEQWHNSSNERLSVWIGPSVLSAMSPELGVAIARVSEDRDLGIAFHCAESPADMSGDSISGHSGPVEYAQSTGIVGRRTVMTHGVHLSPDEIKTLGASGASLVHCPSANAKGGQGVAPVPQMLAAGVNVLLGTDGGPSNDTYDLFNETRLAGLIHRAVAADCGAVTSESVLEMATINGAKALRTGAGALSVGRPADLILYDANRLGFLPTANAIDSLVFASSSAAVSLVMVDGEILLSDGRPVAVDVARLVSQASEATYEAIKAAGFLEEVGSPWLSGPQAGAAAFR